MKKTNFLIKLIAMMLVLSFALFAFASCDSQDDPSVDEGKDSESTDDKDTSGNQDADGADDSEGTADSGDDNPPAEVTYTLDGADGKSGYQIALETGFEGTINEWLDHFADTEDAEKAAELREIFNVKHELRVDENGDFKVLVLSDVQSSSTSLTDEILKNIEIVISKENPDLVIFNGDNSYGMARESWIRGYVKHMAGYCEENQIPWAHVYGNHDDEVSQYYSGLSKDRQQKVYESFDYCVSKAGEEELFGVGNFVLPVMSHDGSRVEFNVWCLDSGAYVENPIDHVVNGSNYFYGIYEYIQQNQIDWYVDSSKLLESFNGELVPAMMTFHIPLQESYTAWSQKEALGLEWDGEKRENISACAVNCGLFNHIVRRGDVKVLVNSHDHLNDFMVKYKGVKMCYTACIGTEVYHADDMLGGRVINFSTKSEDIETHMSYVNERVPVDNDTPILKLKINDDGTVVNDVAGGKTLVNNDYAGLEKKVSKDTEINRNVITFIGDTNKPSTYNLPAADIVRNLADGFSYEAMFKLTDASFSSNYIGVLDFEESGGFGLDIYKSSEANKAVIHADLAYGSGWNTLEYTIDLNKWYHVVFSYDGTNTVLYVNGVEVGRASLTGSFRAPKFSSRSGEEFICIGACSQAWGNDGKKSTGIQGMTGSIAIANVFSKPLTADEAIALYNAIK